MSDYIKKIEKAETPEEAALYIRAFACVYVGNMLTLSQERRITIIEKAEKEAQSLEKDFDGQKPWRQWLKNWGYLKF